MGKKKHGMSSYPEYPIWVAMRNRCNNPNNVNYKNYGGRGITVCSEWNKSFSSFIEDMGRRPKNCELDRIDNNKGYSKENCKWNKRYQNVRNKRNNINVVYKGQNFIAKDLTKKLGIKYQTFIARIKNLGWSVEKAITKETRNKSNKFCPNGHEYVDGSYIITKHGSRRCKECQREYDKKRRPKR